MQYKNVDDGLSHEENQFRTMQRQFKLPPKPVNRKQQKKRRRLIEDEDFSQVVDFRNPQNCPPELKEYLENVPVSVDMLRGCNLKEDAKVYRFSNIPGLYVISNGLTLEQQMYWAYQCMHNYSNAEHTNITNLHGAQDKDIWQESMEKKSFDELYQLRWASLGYHYDWTSRQYKKDNKTSIPKDLFDFASNLSNIVDYTVIPEAGIVNYYLQDSAMGGHIDNAELTQKHPIVSFSLGCKCVFLMGGTTRKIKPTPFFLASGDIVIQGGEAREYFHGIPRIFAHSFPIGCADSKEREEAINKIVEAPLSLLKDVPKEELKWVAEYMTTCRVNLNVRQVVDDVNNWETKTETKNNT